MKEVLIKEYNNLELLKLKSKKPSNSFNFNFTDGAFLEVLGPQEAKYKVEFIDQDSDNVVHTMEISNNMWTKTNIKYFVNWRIKVTNLGTNEVDFDHSYNADGRRVYIHLDSSAIGDTLAWFPYVEEFRKKHNCEVICSTFHNDWFESEYPEIEFITPGTQVYNLYAMYGIGWFYDEDHNVEYHKIPHDFKQLPLGGTATAVLGIDFKEVKPKMHLPNPKRNIKDKYVVIAPHASAHAKYWMYPGGWQKVIDYLKDKGYKVVMITKEPWGDKWHDSKLGGTLKGVINKTGDLPIKSRMEDIYHADAFIGVGSGLSWMSWALNTKTVLISGFSEPYTEFEDCERVFTPKGLCNGCFNREWLNPGDWEWCPDHKNTKRQFECTKSITPQVVINALNKALNIY